MLLLDILLASLIFVFIGIPSLLLFFEIMLGQVKLKPVFLGMKRDACVILIPAHNEELLIGQTLKSLKNEISTFDRILVVADNCTDSTVSICQKNGVEVIQRLNKQQIGKGYALDFGIHYLQDRLIKTVVIVDADCEFTPGSLDKLVKHSQQHDKIVQSMYLMKAAVNAKSKIRLAEFGWLIINKIRSRGRTRLGIGCHLQGSGMAFPRRIFEKVSLASANIVEDLELGLKLLDLGEKVIFDDVAVIISYFPVSDEGIAIQRTRWEHGRLSAISSLPKMIIKGVLIGPRALFWLALDAIIPPTILWLVFVFSMAMLSLLLLFFPVFSPVIILFSCWILLVISITISWILNARDILQFDDIAGAFTYVLAKFPVYKTFFTARQKDWVRTIRGKNKHE